MLGVPLRLSRLKIQVVTAAAPVTAVAQFFFFFFVFLGATPGAFEVPRLGVQSELQLLVYTAATATWDLSCVCDLHPSSWQHRILNPLSKSRDRPILMDTSQVRSC